MTGLSLCLYEGSFESYCSQVWTNNAFMSLKASDQCSKIQMSSYHLATKLRFAGRLLAAVGRHLLMCLLYFALQSLFQIRYLLNLIMGAQWCPILSFQILFCRAVVRGWFQQCVVQKYSDVAEYFHYLAFGFSFSLRSFTIKKWLPVLQKT